MGAFEDLSGRRFSRLVVLQRVPRHKPAQGVEWTCRCDCGGVAVVRASQLKSGKTRSCGCLQREKAAKSNWKHGHAAVGHPMRVIHNTWRKMLDRCHNEKYPEFHLYGGRGIRVADEWHDYVNFVRDMGMRPRGTSIDRIDVDGDYCKENCRWASNFTQNRNKRTNVWIEYMDRRMCQSDWARELGMSPMTIHNRLKAGLPLDKVFQH